MATTDVDALVPFKAIVFAPHLAQESSFVLHNGMS
jgi:hypothetical protein